MYQRVKNVSFLKTSGHVLSGWSLVALANWDLHTRWVRSSDETESKKKENRKNLIIV